MKGFSLFVIILVNRCVLGSQLEEEDLTHSASDLTPLYVSTTYPYDLYISDKNYSFSTEKDFCSKLLELERDEEIKTYWPRNINDANLVYDAISDNVLYGDFWFPAVKKKIHEQFIQDYKFCWLDGKLVHPSFWGYWNDVGTGYEYTQPDGNGDCVMLTKWLYTGTEFKQSKFYSLDDVPCDWRARIICQVPNNNSEARESISTTTGDESKTTANPSDVTMTINPTSLDTALQEDIATVSPTIIDASEVELSTLGEVGATATASILEGGGGGGGGVPGIPGQHVDEDGGESSNDNAVTTILGDLESGSVQILPTGSDSMTLGVTDRCGSVVRGMPTGPTGLLDDEHHRGADGADSADGVSDVSGDGDGCQPAPTTGFQTENLSTMTADMEPVLGATTVMENDMTATMSMSIEGSSIDNGTTAQTTTKAHNTGQTNKPNNNHSNSNRNSSQTDTHRNDTGDTVQTTQGSNVPGKSENGSLETTTTTAQIDASDTTTQGNGSNGNNGNSNRRRGHTDLVLVEVCPCKCTNLSKSIRPLERDETAHISHDIREHLWVDSSNLSQFVRSKTSAHDSRLTASLAGVCGICFILTCIIAIIAADAQKFYFGS